jgi:hypothetical protein
MNEAKLLSAHLQTLPVVGRPGAGFFYVSINELEAILWHRLVSSATEDELADQLVTTYGIAKEQARNDVRDFLDMLGAQGLLES